MKIRNKFGRDSIKGILLGIGASVVMLLLLSGICAWLIDGGKMEIKMLDIGTDVILFVSVLTGAVIAGRGERGLLKGFLCGAGCLLLLVCVNALLLSGTYSGFLTGAIVVGSASVLPGVLNKLPKKSNAKRRRKMRNR